MRVSVIIPAHNSAAFIGETIRSVSRQDHLDIEVIVVNDRSSDALATEVAAVKHPHVALVDSPGRGVSAARNHGLSLATGEYIAFLDADDLWEPRKISSQLRWFGEHSHDAAVGTRMRYLSADGHRTRGVCGEVVQGRTQDIRDGRFMPFPLSSILFRRAALDVSGPFDEQLAHAEDLDLLARIAAAGDVGLIDAPLGSYRVHVRSASATDYRQQRVALAFVQHRARARQRDGSVTDWLSFRRDHEFTRSANRAYISAMSVRRAGVAFVNAAYGRAFLHVLRAALSDPARVYRRVRLRTRRVVDLE